MYEDYEDYDDIEYRDRSCSGGGGGVKKVTQQKRSLDEVFGDLSVRFLCHLPEEELSSFERLFFQIEQAHWFYDDFYCDSDPTLPRMKLKAFSRELFHRSPQLKAYASQ